MKVDESFAIKTDTMRKRVATAACYFVRKYKPDQKFTVRRVADGGWRCWRLR